MVVICEQATNAALQVLKDTCAVTEVCGRKTVCTTDVVFALGRMGKTLYVSRCFCHYHLRRADVVQGYGDAQR